jgi:hypothetical protein
MKVTLRYVGMVRGFFMVSLFMMLRRTPMVLGSLLMMLGSDGVVFRRLFRHKDLLLFSRSTEKECLLEMNSMGTGCKFLGSRILKPAAPAAVLAALQRSETLVTAPFGVVGKAGVGLREESEGIRRLRDLPHLHGRFTNGELSFSWRCTHAEGILQASRHRGRKR